MHSRVISLYPLVAACALGWAVSGCGTEAATAPAGIDAPPAAIVEFVDPPIFVGHRTVTHLVAHDPAGVTRVELYLDEMRVAAVEFAPFDAIWDATGFAAGPHTLRALAYTSDGRTGDATTQIRIDHTEPQVTAAATARRDESFVIDASDDEAGVAQIVVQHGNATLATMTAPPYQFAWPGGACGNVGLHIVATDRVGNQRTIDTTVSATDTQDLDCDSDPQIAFGGGDCDDGDPAYSSRAVDSGASVADFNCDGVPGIDSDRDGVPSTATGGTDCNDAAGNIHAAWLGWTGRPLHLIRDAGGTYAPEFIAMTDTATQLDVAFVDNGALYHGGATLLLDEAVTPISPEQVAAGADGAAEHHPAVLRRADGSLAIAFFADAGLRVAIKTDAADWAITTVDPATGVRLERVEAVGDPTGALHLVYEARNDSTSTTTIRYATDRGGIWSVQTLPEGSRALESPKLGVDSTNRPHVIYEAANQVRHAVLEGGTWATNTVFADNSVVSRYALGLDDFQLLRLVAVVRNSAAARDGLRLGNEFNRFVLGDTAFASVPEQIDELAFNHGDLVLQLHNRATGAPSVQAWTTAGTSQDLHAGAILGKTRSTSTDLRVVVASPGTGLIVAGRNRSVAAALDPFGGADLDCNGTP
jgi:hypothetical protein